MNNRKNHNSILFLTTLGVYLGLVLVGATPQALAQAAMTREFSVKDEIEHKNGLDNKPDDGASSPTSSIHIYLRELDDYLTEVRKADERLGSIYSQNPEFVLLSPCHKIGDLNRPFSVEASGVTRLPILLNPEYKDSNWQWNLGCKPIKDSESEEANFTQVEVSRTQTGVFTYQVSMRLSSSGKASDLFENLKRAFKLVDAADISVRQKVLWENTKLTTTDEKVFIVTRLPRAGLDSLLAKEAK